MVKVADKKLKCFMLRAKNGGMYRTCATPEKDKKPKKQVRGDPKAASKRKLPYITSTGKSLPKRQGPPVAPKPKPKKKSGITIDLEKAKKAGVKVDVDKAKKGGAKIIKPKVAPKSEKINEKRIKVLEEKMKRLREKEKKERSKLREIRSGIQFQGRARISDNEQKRITKQQDILNEVYGEIMEARELIKKLKPKKKFLLDKKNKRVIPK